MRWAGFSSELDQVSFSDLGLTVLSLERDNDMLWSTVQSKWLPHFQRRLQVSLRAGMEGEPCTGRELLCSCPVSLLGSIGYIAA